MNPSRTSTWNTSRAAPNLTLGSWLAARRGEIRGGGGWLAARRREIWGGGAAVRRRGGAGWLVAAHLLFDTARAEQGGCGGGAAAARRGTAEEGPGRGRAGACGRPGSF